MLVRGDDGVGAAVFSGRMRPQRRTLRYDGSGAPNAPSASGRHRRNGRWPFSSASASRYRRSLARVAETHSAFGQLVVGWERA